MTPTEQIEDRLRAALEAQSREVQVPADAWQRNQLRRAADRSHRSRTLLGAAAAVLAVVTVLGAAALVGGDGSGGSPAGGTDDPLSTRYLLGELVESETLTIDGEPTVHEVALSDMTGKGPSLCDRYVAASSGSGGCTVREPSADKPGVAFDWLSGTEGGGDLRGVLAGVDGRVTKVRIWMDNGAMVLAQLHPTGWEDTSMFALTVTDDAPTPQRLVAYGRDGNVLEAADLTVRFPRGWLRERAVCGESSTAGTPFATYGVPGTVRVAFGSQEAQVFVQSPEGVAETCVPLSSTGIAGLAVTGTTAVVVLAPEVERVHLIDPAHPENGIEAEVVPRSGDGAPWRVVVLGNLSSGLLQQGELVALDLNDSGLDREFISRPASP